MKSNSQDWRAITSSVVFKEYMKNELEKEAFAPKLTQDDFLKFQSSIRKDAKLFIEFNKMQDKIIDDVEFRNSLDPKFVQAMLALDLTEGEI